MLKILFPIFFLHTALFSATITAYTPASDQVIVSDPATGDILTTIPGFDFMDDQLNNTPVITNDGKTLYVANTNSANIAVVDTETNEIVSTIPAGNFPSFLLLSPDSAFLYVFSQTATLRMQVLKIDTETNTVVGSTGDLDDLRFIQTAGISNDGSFIFFAAINFDFSDAVVGTIETADITTPNLTTFSVPLVNYGSSAININDSFAYFSSPTGFGETIVLDIVGSSTTTLVVLSTVKNQLLADPTNSSVYGAIESSTAPAPANTAGVSVFNGNAEISFIPMLAQQPSPTEGLAIFSDGTRLYGSAAGGRNSVFFI